MNVWDIGSIVLLVLAGHGLALGLIIWLRADKVTDPNVMLGLLTVVLSFEIGLPKLERLLETAPHLILTGFPLTLLAGPFIYLYIRQIQYPNPEYSSRDLLHFIPFLVVVLYFSSFYLLEGSQKIAYRAGLRTDGFPVIFQAIWGGKILHLLGYLFAANGLLMRSSGLFDPVSFRARNGRIAWLQYLVLGLLAVWFFNLLSFGGFVFEVPWVSYRFAEYLSSFLFSLMVYSIGYIIIFSPERIGDIAYLFQEAGEEREESEKYERSGLSPEKAAEYKRELEAFMDKNKPYRDNDLTLGRLAEMLDIPSNHLSQVINMSLDQNFYDFINGYRIREVKQRLLNNDQKQLTILAVAYDAGFNSKSSFYTAFKKETGQTPSQFIRRNRG